jgi:hypothetical protein
MLERWKSAGSRRSREFVGGCSAAAARSVTPAGWRLGLVNKRKGELRGVLGKVGQHVLMTRQAAGAVDVASIEPKQMSTGLERKSAMLSGKMTPLVKAIELHEEP